MTWVSPGSEYGLDEPNTGPFCLMSTQPCAHAAGAAHKAHVTTVIAAATEQAILG